MKRLEGIRNMSKKRKKRIWKNDEKVLSKEERDCNGGI